MVRVHFTRHLKRFFPDLESLDLEAADVRNLIDLLEQRHRGIADYLIDDRGALRPHVNIFVGHEFIRDRHTLSDVLEPDDEVSIMQALSGG